MKKLNVSVELDLPDDVPATDRGLQQAQRTAQEWLVIKLWEAGHLSTRAAAKKLGITYYDFIDLLGDRGIPVVREMSDDQVIHGTLEQLRKEGRTRS